MARLQGFINTFHLQTGRLFRRIYSLVNPDYFNPDGVEVITGNGNPDLARAIGKILGKTPDEPIIVFASGERTARLSVNCRNKHIFIVQSPSPPHISDHIVELHWMIGAARRASAAEITVVVPYFMNARQDKKTGAREGIDASDEAIILGALGVNRVITEEIHSEQIQGFFKGPWDNLYASAVFLPEIQALGLANIVVGSPDASGAKRAEKFDRLLHGASEDIAIAYKQRPTHNKAKALGLMGNVAGKDVILVDDMFDTCGSLASVAELLKRHGARRIIGMAAHGLFSDIPKEGKFALEILSNSPIEKVYVTDSIAHREAVLNHPKIKVVTVAPLLAEAIKRAHTGQSISELIPR